MTSLSGAFGAAVNAILEPQGGFVNICFETRGPFCPLLEYLLLEPHWNLLLEFEGLRKSNVKALSGNARLADHANPCYKNPFNT